MSILTFDNDKSIMKPTADRTTVVPTASNVDFGQTENREITSEIVLGSALASYGKEESRRMSMVKLLNQKQKKGTQDLAEDSNQDQVYVPTPTEKDKREISFTKTILENYVINNDSKLNFNIYFIFLLCIVLYLTYISKPK